MILSAGPTETELTFTGHTDDPRPLDITSVSLTAGSRKRTQRIGERFADTVGIRVTGPQLRALMNLLNSGAAEIFYTPTKTPEFMDKRAFPMSVSVEAIRKTNQVWSGERIYYIEIDLEGTDLYEPPPEQ